MNTETIKIRKRLNKQQKNRAIELINRGLESQAIADSVGTDVGAIYRLIRAKNAKRNKTKEIVGNAVENSFANKIQRKFNELREKQKFHQEKSEFYANQINEIKNVFAQ